MLFLGRRFRIYTKIIIDGYEKVPYLYFTLALMAYTVPMAYYRWVTESVDPQYNSFRHKNQYTVIRPDDPRLEKYPRKYLTDLSLLEEYERRIGKVPPPREE